MNCYNCGAEMNEKALICQYFQTENKLGKIWKAENDFEEKRVEVTNKSMPFVVDRILSKGIAPVAG